MFLIFGHVGRIPPDLSGLGKLPYRAIFDQAVMTAFFRNAGVCVDEYLDMPRKSFFQSLLNVMDFIMHGPQVIIIG